jgi:hypothetical protein
MATAVNIGVAKMQYKIAMNVVQHVNLAIIFQWLFNTKIIFDKSIS